MVLKPHLRLNGCVVSRIEMLTYLRVRSASNTRDALPLNLICGFETTSGNRAARKGPLGAALRALRSVPAELEAEKAM